MITKIFISKNLFLGGYHYMSMSFPGLSISIVLRSILSRILVFLLLLMLFVPFLIIMLMPQKKRIESRFVYWVMHIFYVGVLKCILMPVIVRGKNNIPDEPVIIAANHQSSLDIPLVGSLLGCHPHMWLARSELMDSWFLRFLLPYFAVVSDVNSPLKAMRSLLKIISLVNGKRSHLLIFPEGQRYDDNDVHAFFGGFVILAKKMGRPVVPVRIFNANKVYARDAFWARWHPITVVVGKPLVIAESETDEEFKLRVHRWFVEQKEE